MPEVSIQRRLTIMDRIYDIMSFPAVMKHFIDSPEVQRLRDMKQLGNTHQVFPGATHTRFEHSLGVCHLGMEFLKKLKDNHDNEIDRNDSSENVVNPSLKDIWCVGIAGLCHDLGHGPLSHMFEAFINRKRAVLGQEEWSHELTSITFFTKIWEREKSILEKEYGFDDTDFEFIKVLIVGLHPSEPWPDNLNRGPHCRYMTEIIANKRNGFDVDKLDYIQRDSVCCFGNEKIPSLSRIFHAARVCEIKGQYQICFTEKIYNSIYEIYATRSLFHNTAYGHRTSRIMDLMMHDALWLADEHFKITSPAVTSPDGTLTQESEHSLSQCVEIPEAYILTGDWIFNAILHSTEEALRRSRSILWSIRNRELYSILYYFPVDFDLRLTSSAEEEILSCIQRSFAPDIQVQMREWEKKSGLSALVLIYKNAKPPFEIEGNPVDPLSLIGFYNPRKSLKECTFSQPQDLRVYSRDLIPRLYVLSRMADLDPEAVANAYKNLRHSSDRPSRLSQGELWKGGSQYRMSGERKRSRSSYC